MLKKRNFVKLVCLIMITFGGVAHAFDLEDYATTYRATRDAYLKASNERMLASGPWKASASAWLAVELRAVDLWGEHPDKAGAINALIGLQKKVQECGL